MNINVFDVLKLLLEYINVFDVLLLLGWSWLDVLVYGLAFEIIMFNNHDYLMIVAVL